MLCYVHVAYICPHVPTQTLLVVIFPWLIDPGLYLQGLLTQFHHSMKLNLILTCVTSYQFLFRAPWPVLTGNLTIGYMGPTAVPVWLLPLQLQMSSVENVSYYLYACAINI